MTTAYRKPKGFRRATRTIDVSVGDSVRIMRELQELSQNELSALTGIPQGTLSAIENDKIKLGLERAKTIARALGIHPAIIAFPGWEGGPPMPKPKPRRLNGAFRSPRARPDTR